MTADNKQEAADSGNHDGSGIILYTLIRMLRYNIYNNDYGFDPKIVATRISSKRSKWMQLFIH
jgi:hypothetical protein